MYSGGNIYDANHWMGGRAHSGAWQGSLEDFTKRDAGLKYDVFRPKKQLAETAAGNIQQVADETKDFSVVNLLSAGLKDVAGVDLALNKKKKARICSEMIYDSFGGTLGKPGQVVSPGWLSKHPGMKRRYQIVLDYDKETGQSVPQLVPASKLAGMRKTSALRELCGAQDKTAAEIGDTPRTTSTLKLHSSLEQLKRQSSQSLLNLLTKKR